MADIQLEYRVPDADLRSYVTLFYHFRAKVMHFDDIERADHAQLRFRLSPGTGTYEFPGVCAQETGMVHLIGPTSGVMRTRAEGPVEVVGMGLQPAGWAALVGADASAMHDRVFDGATIFGDAAAVAADAMRATDDTDAKIAIVADFVRTLIARADPAPCEFALEIDAWLAGSASPDIAMLVAATKLSRRQVERRCNALYGAPPKVLARKYRALRAAVALASGSATLDTLIGQGFYDQSHLIREMKQFTGMTPNQIRTRPSELVRLTIAARLALGGRVHPIISET